MLRFATPGYVMLNRGADRQRTHACLIGTLIVVLVGCLMALSAAPAAGAQSTTTLAPDAPGELRQPQAADFPGLTKGIRFAQGSVAFLPEYDTQDVLVLVDYQLPSDAKVPFTFQFRIPKGARMNSYALANASGGFDHEGLVAPRTIAGTSAEWDTVEFQVPRNQPIHLEYYYNPGLNTAAKRDFPVIFESPATIDQLTFSVQQPARASSFALTPPLAGQAQDGFGLTSSSSSLPGLKPGEIVKTQVSYEKPDASPSNTAGSEPSVEGETTTNSSTNYLLWLLAVLVVGVVGFAAYRTLGRRAPSAPAARRSAPVRKPARQAPPRSSTRPAPRPSTRPSSSRSGSRTPNGSSAAFCTQCGRGFESDDRFCGGCGQGRET